MSLPSIILHISTSTPPFFLLSLPSTDTLNVLTFSASASDTPNWFSISLDASGRRRNLRSIGDNDEERLGWLKGVLAAESVELVGYSEGSDEDPSIMLDPQGKAVLLDLTRCSTPPLSIPEVLSMACMRATSLQVKANQILSILQSDSSLPLPIPSSSSSFPTQTRNQIPPSILPPAPAAVPTSLVAPIASSSTTTSRTKRKSPDDGASVVELEEKKAPPAKKVVKKAAPTLTGGNRRVKGAAKTAFIDDDDDD
ncbi:hypothetical protein BT69DRAFT_1278236 [Atractiella rhizophila]|nr:hypothetical protein BT69DRAFT_1278236 [Atractiella rhizophila]